MGETKIEKTDREWREQLTPAQYDVLRKAGTEAPFTGEYVDHKADGSYRCAACGAMLFGSDTKFDSGTGWPSFTEPAVAEAVELRPDNGLFMRRTEVLCRTCGGHLGHVFDDEARPPSATASTRLHWPSSRARMPGPPPPARSAPAPGRVSRAKMRRVSLRRLRMRRPPRSSLLPR